MARPADHEHHLNGNLQAQYGFDPYGRQARFSESQAADFKYAGYYQHQNSGLYLTLFRAYSTKLGRWISRDPLIIPQTNLYNYTVNAPTMGVDPLGLITYAQGSSQIADARSKLKDMCDCCYGKGSDKAAQCKKQADSVMNAIADTWWNNYNTAYWNPFTVGGGYCFNWSNSFYSAVASSGSSMFSAGEFQAQSGNAIHAWVQIELQNPTNPGAKCKFWLDNGYVNNQLFHWNSAPVPASWYLGIPFLLPQTITQIH